MKAVALFSGGLDSTLALKVVLEEGIEVVALHFFSPFCTCSKKGCGFSAAGTAKKLGVELKTYSLGEEYISIVRNPKHGYGKNLNPCIDCRILLFSRAKEFMQNNGASFIITGEVLGQRPKSQHRRALNLIERESGLEGLILRPLSAKLLKKTIPEKEGWIQREKLLNFWGRSRKPQIRLAGIFGVEDYPCPAGGCLLTDPSFCRRLKDLFAHGEDSCENAELLKVGRHFRLGHSSKLVIGRDEGENKRLALLARDDDLLLEPKELKGPLGLGRGSFDQRLKELSSRILARYTSSSNGKLKVSLRIVPQTSEDCITIDKLNEEAVERLRV